MDLVIWRSIDLVIDLADVSVDLSVPQSLDRGIVGSPDL
jgi:hypothetical protein